MGAQVFLKLLLNLEIIFFKKLNEFRRKDNGREIHRC
jgi:hypothetical protein